MKTLRQTRTFSCHVKTGTSCPTAGLRSQAATAGPAEAKTREPNDGNLSDHLQIKEGPGL